MARIIIALVRHGDYHQQENTPSALQPHSLNDNGQAQAVVAASEMQATIENNSWQLSSVIESSPLLRAWQTADIFRHALQNHGPHLLKINCDDALCERSVGSAANLSLEQIEAVLERDPRAAAPPKNWKSDSHYQLPLVGAESLMMAGQRVADHIRAKVAGIVSEQLNAPQSQASATLKIFVGHGAAFRHAAHLLGVLSFDEIASLSMHHATPVYLEYLGEDNWQHIAGDWKQRDKSTFVLD